MSFFEIFQPGLQHLREEKDRQRMLVVKPTPGAGPPLGIDLFAGTAKITVRPAAAAQPVVEDDEDDESETGAPDRSATDGVDGDDRSGPHGADGPGVGEGDHLAR